MNRALIVTLFLLLAPAMQGLSMETTDIGTEVQSSSTSKEPAKFIPAATRYDTANSVVQGAISKQIATAPANSSSEQTEVPEWLSEIDPATWLREQLEALPIADQQAPGIEMLRFMAQPNGTNETALNNTGTATHIHNGVGGNGLFEAWSVPFYGETRIILEVDVDKDGINDAVLGTSSAVVAISGTSKQILWAYHVGNTITSLEFIEDRDQLLFSTLWEGQLGEVGLLGAMDGHVFWKQTDQTHFLSTTAQSDGILIATVNGFVEKWDFNGNVQWSYDTRIIPDTSAIVAAHINLGSYLAESADFNGDGITDMAVATLNYRFAFGLYVYSIEFYTQIHAVDGATGAMLWLSTENADPVNGISINALADLEAFDARGDGSMDLAYDGFTLRWYLLPFVPTLPTYETYLRALDGDSTTVAQPMGGRTLGGVLLPLEFYGDIERVDANNDGKEEVAVIRLDVANALLSADAVAVESYSFLPHAPDSGATMVLSEVVFHNGNGATLSSFEGNGRELFIGSFADNTGLRVSSNLLDAVPLEFSAPPLVGGTLNGEAVVASKSDFITSEAQTPLRGVPLSVHSGNFDADGTPDFFIQSSDGFLYAIDGLNGQVVGSMQMPGTFIASDDTDLDGQNEFIFAVETGSDGRLLALQFDGTEVWSAFYNAYNLGLAQPKTFDGNQDGVLDYLVQTRDATAINGRTGTPLWETSNDLGYYVYKSVALENGDIMIEDWNELVLINGKTGEEKNRVAIDSWDNISCLGSMPTISGPQPLAIGYNQIYDYIFTYGITSMGTKELNLFSGDYVYSCHIMNFDDGALVSIGFRNTEDEFVQGVLRIQNGGVAWSNYAVAAGGNLYQPIGVDRVSNRVFFAYEDHVRGLNWTTGAGEADFTVNGPFLVDGAMVNIDRLGSSEIATISSNGIVWLMSQSADIKDTLVKQAELQGKAPLETASLAQPESRESPFGSLVLLGIALLAFVIRRR